MYSSFINVPCLPVLQYIKLHNTILNCQCGYELLSSRSMRIDRFLWRSLQYLLKSIDSIVNGSDRLGIQGNVRSISFNQFLYLSLNILYLKLVALIEKWRQLILKKHLQFASVPLNACLIFVSPTAKRFMRNITTARY